MNDSNVGMVEISKTNKTVSAYLKRGQQLWNRAANTREIPSIELKTDQFISYLNQLLPTVKPATRRQYLASAREYIGLLMSHQHIDTHRPFILTQHQVQLKQMQANQFSTNTKLKRNRKLNTSEQKAKQIISDDIKILIEKTKGLSGRWIQPALIWMVASLLVGLRPIEWRQAGLITDDNQTILKVVNAKNSNDRAHGQFRHIDLSNLKPVELSFIKKQLSIVALHNKDDQAWQAYYEGCRKTIHKITREYLPKQKKYPTLYSARHQFAANVKLAGMAKIEIAALMGHATDETAGFHYGKKKHGKLGCRVKASQIEIQKIRIITKPHRRARKIYI
jgi:hypothetical protein